LFVKGAVLLAALLVAAPQVLAGGRVYAGRATPSSQPAPAPVVRTAPVVVPVTVSVVVTEPARSATEQMRVDLRGPDGQLRSFALEGGRDAIQSQPVLVLRPGQSLTIRLAAK
jgi:hypothetical protein